MMPLLAGMYLQERSTIKLLKKNAFLFTAKIKKKNVNIISSMDDELEMC